MKRVVKFIFQSPLLSISLFLLWLLLNQSMSAGTLVMGVVVALAVPMLTNSLRPNEVRIRKPWVAAVLAWHVFIDTYLAIAHVAWLLLTRRASRIHSDFVLVPLDLRDPSALAVLTMITCLTPGTAWAEISLDRSALLIHVFDMQDKDATIALIKSRYERPLMEIFQ